MVMDGSDKDVHLDVESDGEHENLLFPGRGEEGTANRLGVAVDEDETTEMRGNDAHTDLCLEQVEEAIRQAEALMSRDGGRRISRQREPDAEGDDVIAKDNRYKDPKAREELIQRLLKERETTKTKPKARPRPSSAKTDSRSSSAPRAFEKKRPSTPKATSWSVDLQEKALRHRKDLAKSTPRKHSFSRKSLDQVKLEVEQKLASVCTFKPKINPNSKKALRKRESKEQTLQRLAQPKEIFWQDKEKEHKTEQDELHKKHCTFKPDLSKTAGQTGKTTKLAWQERLEEIYRTHIPVEQRLHLDASERWVARERAKRELEDAMLESQPFAPKVNEVSERIVKTMEYKPIQERAAEVQREKQKRLARAKLESERGDPNLTFRPTISEVSQRLVRKKSNQVKADVGERLSKQSEEIHRRKVERQQAWIRQQEQECKFQPTVSATSKALVEQNPVFKGRNKDFVERQAELERKRLHQERKIRSKLYSEGGMGYTFKPSIGNAEKVLMQSRPERLAESEEERIERLAKRDLKRREKVRNHMNEQYYSQYNFKPKINRVSKALAGSGSGFEELYKNEKSKQTKRMMSEEVEEQLRQECTFKPRTNPVMVTNKQINHAEPDRVVEEIETQRRKREERLQQQRREQEYKQLRECTFIPSVNESSPVKAKGPVIVRGLGRYLELRESARRQDEEQKEREDKVFIRSTSRRSEPYTIPQPFNFSTALRRREGSRNHHDGTVPNSEMDGNKLNHQPSTLSSSRRKMIEKILAS